MRITLLLLFISIVIGPIVRAQSNFEMGYIHPLLNQGFSTQLNASPERANSIEKYFRHTWIGIFSNIKQKYSINLGFGTSKLDYRYANAFLIEHPVFSEYFTTDQVRHGNTVRPDNIHVSFEAKFHEWKRYTLWFGLGLHYLNNFWTQDKTYKIGREEKSLFGNSFNTYTSRLDVNRVGANAIIPISTYVNHKFIFKKREICIKTGIQFILPQNLDVNLTNKFVYHANQYSTTIRVPGSVMLYTGVQLNRVLRFRNFGKRAKSAYQKWKWLLPQKIEETDE